MEREFWHERWRNNEIGFHADTAHPLLERHWPGLGLAADARVFVPLCGKSLDMAMLREQGHDVVGVDLSPVAIESFVSEQGLATHVDRIGDFVRHSTDGYDLLIGDFFALDAQALGPVGIVYDRASLVALPDEMRARYAAKLRELLSPDAVMLLVTLQYELSALAGPPFSVTCEEVEKLFGSWCSIEHLETVPAEVKGHPVQETASILVVS